MDRRIARRATRSGKRASFERRDARARGRSRLGRTLGRVVSRRRRRDLVRRRRRRRSFRRGLGGARDEGDATTITDDPPDDAGWEPGVGANADGRRGGDRACCGHVRHSLTSRSGRLRGVRVGVTPKRRRRSKSQPRRLGKKRSRRKVGGGLATNSGCARRVSREIPYGKIVSLLQTGPRKASSHEKKICTRKSPRRKPRNFLSERHTDERDPRRGRGGSIHHGDPRLALQRGRSRDPHPESVPSSPATDREGQRGTQRDPQRARGPRGEPNQRATTRRHGDREPSARIARADDADQAQGHQRGHRSARAKRQGPVGDRRPPDAHVGVDREPSPRPGRGRARLDDGRARDSPGCRRALRVRAVRYRRRGTRGRESRRRGRLARADTRPAARVCVAGVAERENDLRLQRRPRRSRRPRMRGVPADLRPEARAPKQRVREPREPRGAAHKHLRRVRGGVPRKVRPLRVPDVSRRLHVAPVGVRDQR